MVLAVTEDSIGKDLVIFCMFIVMYAYCVGQCSEVLTVNDRGYCYQ